MQLESLCMRSWQQIDLNFKSVSSELKCSWPLDCCASGCVVNHLSKAESFFNSSADHFFPLRRMLARYESLSPPSPPPPLFSWRQGERASEWSQRQIRCGWRADCAFQWKHYSVVSTGDKLLMGSLEKKGTKKGSRHRCRASPSKFCIPLRELLICFRCHSRLCFPNLCLWEGGKKKVRKCNVLWFLIRREGEGFFSFPPVCYWLNVNRMRRQLRGEIRLSGSIIAAIKLRRCSIARNKCRGRQINCRIDFEFCLSSKMSCQNIELNLSWRHFRPPFSPPSPSPHVQTIHLFFSFIILVSNLWHWGVVLPIYGNGLSFAGNVYSAPEIGEMEWIHRRGCYESFLGGGIFNLIQIYFDSW